MKKILPVGLQSFKKVREGHFMYIDKTKIIHRLTRSGNYFFLSRPRRFGKSLTVNTLESLFKGEKQYFQGLYIEDKWDWSQKYPVIRIGFSSIGYKELGLERAIAIELAEIAQSYGIELTKEGISQRFEELIKKLSTKQQVVILIDEYDKPIIDYLTDLPQAYENQAILKSFYSILKDADDHVRLLFITGVSKFSKVSIFSELNNLTDISIDKRFASLVGITQTELNEYLEDYLVENEADFGWSREKLLEQIKIWYNGYSWDGKTFLYNPFSLFSFMQAGDFRNFWFATGTPTFLVKLLKGRNFYNIKRTRVGQAAFESFNIDNINTYSILFQTGYLTIKAREEFGIYVLDYPNREVKDSMLQHLVAEFSHGDYTRTTPIVVDLRTAFLEHDLERVIKIINGLFKSIPYQIFIADKEAYYHSVVYLVFQYLGLFIDAEINTSDGRIDAVVKTPAKIYVIEFKLDESAEIALQQIKNKDYSSKYDLDKQSLIGVGINFSSETKSIAGWKVERLD